MYEHSSSSSSTVIAAAAVVVVSGPLSEFVIFILFICPVIIYIMALFHRSYTYIHKLIQHISFTEKLS